VKADEQAVELSPSELKPWKRNPRKNEGAVDKVARSIERFGFASPIVARAKDRRIVAGHTRWKAAKKLELESVPVRLVELSDEEAEALALADNRLGEVAQWDPSGLAEILSDLQEFDETIVEIAGFEQPVDPDSIVESGPEPEPDPEKDPVVKRGDVWRLGEHVIACGDCTDQELVRKIRPEGEIFLIADPPYCSGGFQESGRREGSVGTKSVTGKVRKVASDTLSTRGYLSLLKRTVQTWDPASAYVFTDWRQWVNLFDLAEGEGFQVRSMIVWDKLTAGMGHGWRARHELILFATKESVPFDLKAGVGNVIPMARTGNKYHTTQKPVPLIVTILEVHPSGIVADPFAGSGSTMLACEQVGRRFVGCEYEPGHCDTAIQRWEAATGGSAKKVASSG